jgi:sterol desaturase/sphingolipid hydroxylase (fatty acid hydroxylase superfamily)
MSKVHQLATWMVWPVTLTVFLCAYAGTQRLGYDPGLSLLALTIGHFVVIMGLEVLMPARRDWSWYGDRQAFNDLIHGALLDVGGRLGTAILTVAIAAVAANLSAQVNWRYWPTSLPLWAQIGAAIVIFDFIDYWKHRAFHAWAWLWPVHALHHNPPRMHIFKAGRLHFLEASARALFTTAPLVVLGAPPELFFWLAALLNGMGDQNHWNVETRFPRFMHLIISTPQVHWLHHAKDITGGSSNYSSFTLLFDHLFGTYRDPTGVPIQDVGIDVDPIPKNLFGQIASPFIWPWLTARFSAGGKGDRSHG